MFRINDLKLENKPERVIFAIFFLFVMIFILLHSLYVIGINLPTSGFSKDLYRVTHDHSYAEFFQYVVLLGSCFLIIFISILDKKYLFFFPFLLLLLLDDYFTIHDKYSTEIFKFFLPFFKTLSELSTLRIKDFFELSWHFISLIFFLFSLFIIKFQNNEIKVFLKKYVFAVLCLIFFALIVDILGVKIIEIIDTPKHFINTLIYFLEEGGEMITCSYLFSIFFGLYIKKLN